MEDLPGGHVGEHHSAVTFSQLEIRVLFANLTVAVVHTKPFRVPAGGTLPLPSVVRA